MTEPAAPPDQADVVVVGGGHNGLVAACYLARAGLDVVVLEQSDRLGGGSRTDELIPGYRFDTHSVAHNIINMTDIPAELELPAAGLAYREMDPFSVAVFADGPIVRFHRSVEATVDSIRAVSPADADRYAGWMREALPLVRAALSGIEAGASRARILRQLPGRLLASGQALARGGGPFGLAQTLTMPYGRLLAERLATDRARAPVAAFAAHGSAAPHTPGTAFFGIWQAVYHLTGQWHAVGGSGALVDALAHRLAALGGRALTETAVTRIRQEGGAVRGVELAGGHVVRAPRVLTAVDPRVALLDLLEPPLAGRTADRLRATHRGNGVQMLVHLAVTALPAYPGAQPGDWSGLQSFVDTVDSLACGFAAAEDRRLPEDPVPTYAFTPSALDDSLAPPGHHTVYLACPCAPYDVRDGWPEVQQDFARRMIDTVERRVPGFRSTIVDARIRTPADMAAQLHWPGAHPMYLDITLDQLAWMRPTRDLAGHATPIRGLFVTGAGTAPVGGVAGSPGRAAARAVLASR